jgi:hypothetical protein
MFINSLTLKSLLPVVLFVLLSPGVLLTIPGSSSPVDLVSSRTSRSAVVVHALVFFVVLNLLKSLV